MKRHGRAAQTGVDTAAARVREANARVHQTANERDRPGGMERWHAALSEFDAAMRQLYPPTLQADIERLKAGDPGAIEAAIAFLEADPWAFGTGYTKETILRRLRSVELTSRQEARLRDVVLDQVDHHDRREFRRYCLLATRLVDDGFRGALLDRFRSNDPGTARRALWVLDAVDLRLEPADRAIAQAIIEAVASSHHAWRHDAWLRTAVRRHRDAAWLAALVEKSSTGGPDGDGARYLLASSGSILTPKQRERLAAGSEGDAAKIQADFEARMHAVRVAFGYDFATADIHELLRSLDDEVPGPPAS